MNESAIDAAKRRVDYELGITETEIQMALPDYRYRFERDGIVENEFCPVMIGLTHQQPSPNPDEVESVKWISWKEWVSLIKSSPQNYSEWCVEETMLLLENPAFTSFFTKFD